MCGRRASTSLAWRSTRAFSLLAAVSFHVSHGSYFPGMTGTTSQIWWLNMISTPQSRKDCWVNAAVNSGPPSDANSSTIPYVTKHSFIFILLVSCSMHSTCGVLYLNECVCTRVLLSELAQIRLTYHQGSEVYDTHTLIGLLLEIVERYQYTGHHNLFAFDSQPAYGVENVYFWLLLDAVVVLEYDIAELFAARVH